ncbi:MAG: hypothetical protein JNM76_14685 [Betaproteobacteria bacterium]|nr:hypothetical protein [Betaproteobacteria bacterium]
MTTENPVTDQLLGVIRRVPGTGRIETVWRDGKRPARLRLVDELAMIEAFYVEEHSQRIAGLATREQRLAALANIRSRKDGAVLGAKVEARVREIWAQRSAATPTELKAAA